MGFEYYLKPMHLVHQFPQLSSTTVLPFTAFTFGYDCDAECVCEYTGNLCFRRWTWLNMSVVRSMKSCANWRGWKTVQRKLRRKRSAHLLAL